MSWLPSVAKGRRTPEIGAEVAVDQLGRWHLHPRRLADRAPPANSSRADRR